MIQRSFLTCQALINIVLSAESRHGIESIHVSVWMTLLRKNREDTRDLHTETGPGV